MKKFYWVLTKSLQFQGFRQIQRRNFRETGDFSVLVNGFRFFRCNFLVLWLEIDFSCAELRSNSYTFYGLCYKGKENSLIFKKTYSKIKLSQVQASLTEKELKSYSSAGSVAEEGQNKCLPSGFSLTNSSIIFSSRKHSNSSCVRGRK